jgi:hypothetical protein
MTVKCGSPDLTADPSWIWNATGLRTMRNDSSLIGVHGYLRARTCNSGDDDRPFRLERWGLAAGEPRRSAQGRPRPR